MSDTELELLVGDLTEELQALRHELRQLRHGELVARLTDAERRAIAERVLDGLDERFLAERVAATDKAPTRRQERRYFE